MTETGKIELSYTPTVEDFKEALGARARTSKSARRTRWLLAATGVCLTVATVLGLAQKGRLDVPLIVGLAVFVVILLGQTGLQARSFHRLAAAKGEQRIVVDESGVTVSTAQATHSLSWPATPRYVETPGIFLLLSGDENASTMTLLPKRGLGAATDVDRLRAVLDQYSVRAGAERNRPRP
ncbi:MULTISPECIES: YcxB family protein [Streptomyces]|uniref:YcxB-like protein n=1 Tax=Streptomyces yunnanensis TaxID=156453 RepID=A0A9X8QQN3_9ACTN|nr:MULTISPECIES: YcxB family protein [Streptomyces]SHL39399.1 YcxB-like protein [Streptomyces yunnanensis]